MMSNKVLKIWAAGLVLVALSLAHHNAPNTAAQTTPGKPTKRATSPAMDCTNTARMLAGGGNILAGEDGKLPLQAEIFCDRLPWYLEQAERYRREPAK
jgi:hypothetical protein